MTKHSTDDRPRVLHTIDSLRLGGAEALLAALVRELKRSERSWNAVFVPFAADADQGLIRQIRESADVFREVGSGPLYDPRLPLALLRAIRGLKVDVVHSHLSTANVSSRAAAALAWRPHMATIHTQPGPTAEDTRLRAFADGWSSWLSKKLVAPSPEIAVAYRRAFRLPASRLAVIPNAPAAAPPGDGFDRDALRRELAGGDDDPFIVLTVARLQPEKGIGELLDAAAAIRERSRRVRFAVVGDGPERALLAERLSAGPLGDTVRLLGTRSDVGALLRAADLFCLPSRHEGLPVSLLEAMDAGVPCVATAVGGVPGLVADGETGLLVPARDPEALAGAVERVAAESELARRLGSAGQALVRERYGLAAMASGYADLYDSLRPAR